MLKRVKFINKDKTDFFPTLSVRVNQYFKDNNISRYANAEMVLKTIGILAIFFVPYGLLISGYLSLPLMFLMACIMGVGKAGIGLSIMHDANHGGYSSNPMINKFVEFSMYIVGGNRYTWKLQHNVLHHTYTNIYGMDEDIDPPKGLMRFSPEAKHYLHQKYQHIYSVFFYGLMTFFWASGKDFLQLYRYKKKGLVKGPKYKMAKEIGILIVSKIVYYIYLLYIPMMLLDITFGQWFIGFFCMHFIAGVILALIFQMAHAITETKFPVPDDKRNIENEWAVHQMYTTANFARSNKLLSWYVGGLNYQVEHHLFPKICHIHYSKLATIVKNTAEEFGLPYHDHPTFVSALKSHFKLMKELGNPKTVLAA